VKPWWSGSIVALAAVLLAACGGGSSGGQSTATSSESDSPTATAELDSTAAPESPELRFGVAGFIPPNWPNPSNADWSDLFESFSETGDLIGVYTGWADSPQTEGEIPAVVRTAFEIARQQDLVPVVAIGTTSDSPTGVVPSIDWSNQAQVDRFIATVVAIAETYEPEYLAIGGEVNRLWESDPEAFGAFVAGYRLAYSAAKDASPTTRVFTVFQLEMLRGDAFLAGNSDSREPQWPLIDQFEGALDLVGFTSYPFLDYETPGVIPDGYYAALPEQLGLPVLITEIGWPSAPLAAAPQSTYGGSPEEQTEFVTNIPRLVGPGVEGLLWSFPNDVGTSVSGPFESVALRSNNGTAKPALAAWQSLLNE
jgi:hypothetical protein